MSINDTLSETASSLAGYLFDPEYPDLVQWRTGQRHVAVLAICRGLLNIEWAHDQIDAAVDGDMGPLEKHMQYIQEHFADRVGPPDQERREWQSLVDLCKALDEHIIPLLPSLEWTFAEERAEALAEHEKSEREWDEHERERMKKLPTFHGKTGWLITDPPHAGEHLRIEAALTDDWIGTLLDVESGEPRYHIADTGRLYTVSALPARTPWRFTHLMNEEHYKQYHVRP